MDAKKLQAESIVTAAATAIADILLGEAHEHDLTDEDVAGVLRRMPAVARAFTDTARGTGIDVPRAIMLALPA